MMADNPIIITLPYTADLDRGPVEQYLPVAFGTGDKEAHKLILTAYRATGIVDLTGAGVLCYVNRADKTTVVVDGEVVDGKAVVVLPEECYIVNGVVSIIVKLTMGDTRTTALWLNGNINRTRNGKLVDPGGVVPSLEELLAQIDNMEAATAEATAAAEAAQKAATDSEQRTTTAITETQQKADAAIARVHETLAGALGDVTDALAESAPAILLTASGEVVQISDGAARPALSLVSQISAVQSGSGDPSPDNVRPITGWGAVRLMHSGRNMIRYPYIDGTTGDTITKNGLTITFVADGSVHVVGTASTTTFVNLCSLPGLSESNITEGSTVAGITATDCRYTYANGLVTIRIAGGATVDKTYYPMLTTSGATAFEPYDGVTLTAELPETVYGGTIDWLTGVLTVTHGHIEAYAGEDVPDGWVSSVGALTDGAQVVYPLAEPYTIQLDPQTLDMLRGYNTLWCRTGSTAVGYVADTQMYVESHGGGGDAGFAEYAAYAERAGEADNALAVGGLQVQAVPITDWDTITPAASTVYLVYDPEVTA